ncbi:MAG: phosphonate ABC transporter, permease protein PhnE, partial [Acetobacteraceae bacterium]|nr:phosphonate ABC transporter, permease protein PhnE [Acetobacteraceae bacterium]
MSTTTQDHILAADRKAGMRQALLVACLLLVCAAALTITGFFDAARFAEGIPALAQLFSEMIPPDFSRWQHWLRPLLDTLAMSIAGTILAVILSLPLALLAAPNTTPFPALGYVARLLLSLLRSVPELILGIIFVAAVGFGALPG